MVAFLPLFIAAQALLGAPARAETLLTTVEEIVASALQVVSVSGLLDFIGSIPLGTKPANQAEAVEAIGKALNESGGSPLAFAGLLKSAGAFPGDDALTLNDVVEQISGCGEPCSANNSNTREPNPSVYAPVEGDAPWHLSEADLRKALYFPPDYTFGKVKPLLMVPGTGMFPPLTTNIRPAIDNKCLLVLRRRLRLAKLHGQFRQEAAGLGRGRSCLFECPELPAGRRSIKRRIRCLRYQICQCHLWRAPDRCHHPVPRLVRWKN